MKAKTIWTTGIVTLASIAGLGAESAIAQMGQQELEQNGIRVIASPYQGGAMHQLLILEQLASTRACWDEQASSTVTIVNPLLLGFDFSGICGRATDSNGFSVRMGGRDFDWRYALQVVNQNNDLVLIARSTLPNSTLPNLVIGRVGGTTTDFAKIRLEPGWRVTRRIAQGKLTGHFYLTNDQTIEQVAAAMQQRQPAITSVAPIAAPAPITAPAPAAPVPTVSAPSGSPAASIEAPVEFNAVAPGAQPVVPPSPGAVPPSPGTLR